MVSGHFEKMGANGIQAMMSGQPPIGVERTQQLEPRRRAMHLATFVQRSRHHENSSGGPLITCRTSIGMLIGDPPGPGAADARAAIAYACSGLSTSTIQ
jgi:hypothetical protein